MGTIQGMGRHVWCVLAYLLRAPLPNCVFASCSGDIIKVEIPGNTFYLVNSPEAMTDLLEKRSGIYSSRPNAVMAGL